MAGYGRNLVWGALVVSLGLMALDIRFADSVKGPMVIDIARLEGMAPRYSEMSGMPSAERSGTLVRDMVGLDVLKVVNPMGSVTATKADDGKMRCLYTVKVYSGDGVGDGAAAREYAERVKVAMSVSGKSLLLKRDMVRAPESVKGVAVDLKLFVPEGVTPVINNKYGSVDVRDIASGAEIDNSFGSTIIGGIGGDLRVDVKYSDTNIGNVRGDLRIDSGFAKAFVTDVTGDVAFDARYGNFSARNIGGNLEGESWYGAINAAGIGGNLDVEGRYAPVTVGSLKGRATIGTRFGAVSIDGLANDAEIETSYGDVRLGLRADSEGYSVDAGVNKDRFEMSPIVKGAFKEESRKNVGKGSYIKGRIGNGKNHVRIRCSNGSVTLNQE